MPVPRSLLALALIAAAPLRAQVPAADEAFASKASAELRCLVGGDPAAAEELRFGVWLDDHGLAERALETLWRACADLDATDHPAAAELTREHQRWLAARLACDVVQPFVAAAVELGAVVERPIALAPAVELRGRPSALRALAARPEVLHLWVPRDSFPEQGTAIGTVRAREIPGRSTSTLGAGVTVGLCDAAHPYPTHPLLPSLTTLAFHPHGQHATAVAGMIASSDATHRGVAPGVAGLVSHPGIPAAGDVILAGAQVVNVSLYDGHTDRSLHAYDRLYDYWIRATGRLIVKSAGNQGTAGGAVTTPGKGWNTLAVGNLADARTTQWSDDGVHPTSSFADPSSGAPKPELVAPGTQLGGAISYPPWTAEDVGTGTSYAAPHVTGAAAVLIAADARLQWKPAGLRALLMATAWNELEGPVGCGERAGAGGLDVRAAWNVLHAPPQQGRFLAGVFSPISFDGAGRWEWRVHLEAHNAARVVFAWLAQASGSAPHHRPHGLDATFELEVVDPSGVQVFAAPPRANAAFRVLRFVPPMTGSYVVRIVRTRYAGYLEPFGLAVSQVFDAHTAEVVVASGSLRLGERTWLEAFDPHVEEGYGALLPSLSGVGWGNGIPLGERTLPIVDDGLWRAAIDPANGLFHGLLGARGPGAHLRARIDLPADPALLALPPLGLTFAAFDRRGTITAISPPLRLVPHR